MKKKLIIFLALAVILGTSFLYLYSRQKTDIKIEAVKELDKGTVQFKMSNFGRELAFTGYEPREPLCDVEVKRNGKWQQVTNHWCGTGMVGFSIKRNEQIYFQCGNYYTKSGIWRLKVTFYVEQETGWLSKVFRYVNIEPPDEIVVYSEPMDAVVKYKEVELGGD